MLRVVAQLNVAKLDKGGDKECLPFTGGKRMIPGAAREDGSSLVKRRAGILECASLLLDVHGSKNEMAEQHGGWEFSGSTLVGQPA